MPCTGLLYLGSQFELEVRLMPFEIPFVEYIVYDNKIKKKNCINWPEVCNIPYTYTINYIYTESASTGELDPCLSVAI